MHARRTPVRYTSHHATVTATSPQTHGNLGISALRACRARRDRRADRIQGQRVFRHRLRSDGRRNDAAQRRRQRPSGRLDSATPTCCAPLGNGRAAGASRRVRSERERREDRGRHESSSRSQLRREGGRRRPHVESRSRRHGIVSAHEPTTRTQECRAANPKWICRWIFAAITIKGAFPDRLRMIAAPHALIGNGHVQANATHADSPRARRNNWFDSRWRYQFASRCISLH